MYKFICIYMHNILYALNKYIYVHKSIYIYIYSVSGNG